MKTLRLRCPCGRNLADVTDQSHRSGGTNPDWTRDGLTVTARPNVAQEDFRAWHEANMGRPSGRDGRDWHARTYSWRCRCGSPWSRRHERISEAWERAQSATPDGRGIVVAVFDVDV